MADYTVFDSTGTVVTFKGTLNGSVLTPHKNIDLFCGQSVAFGAGAANAGTLRVILASDSPGVGGGGGGGDATAANQTDQLAQETAAAASLAIIDDWDESDRAKVNIIAGQAGVAAGAGAAGAGVIRTVTASDSPEIPLLGAVTETPPASDTASSGLNGRLQRIAQRITSLIALLPAALGSQANSGSLSVAPSTDQDPIFDHASGTKSSVTSSATVITTGSGHKYLRIVSDVDVYVNTAGNTAVDDGTSILIKANLPEVIPVPPSTAIKALSSSGTAVVRCTPMKVR